MKAGAFARTGRCSGPVSLSIRSETRRCTVGFSKVTRDLTERHKAEEALRRTEEQFRILIQGVTDYAIYMLDWEGRVTSWNAGAERIKGYAPAESLASISHVSIRQRMRMRARRRRL